MMILMRAYRCYCVGCVHEETFVVTIIFVNRCFLLLFLLPPFLLSSSPSSSCASSSSSSTSASRLRFSCCCHSSSRSSSYLWTCCCFWRQDGDPASPSLPSQCSAPARSLRQKRAARAGATFIRQSQV